MVLQIVKKKIYIYIWGKQVNLNNEHLKHAITLSRIQKLKLIFSISKKISYWDRIFSVC